MPPAVNKLLEKNMKLTKKQFSILVTLEADRKSKSQRELAAAAGLSVGTVNKLVAELCEQGMISDGVITEAGIAALEPYRVKRAVFMISIPPPRRTNKPVPHCISFSMR